MDNNVFNEICNIITSLVKELGENYNIEQLEGRKKDGKTAKRVIVEVNGQNYLQVDFPKMLVYSDIFPKTKFQKAIYYCYPDENNEYKLLKNGKTIINNETFSVEKFMEEVFDDITNKIQNRQKVAEILGDLMNCYIPPHKLGYDINDQTYHFLDWNKTDGTEYLFFCNYFRGLRKYEDQDIPYLSDCVAKYTSLDTALMILNSGKMRMMSVTAMNDKMEIGHLYGNLCNGDSAYLENKTKIDFARKRYITSFTDKIDDLTMWRLYGDNGKGVCLLFSEPYECDYYFPVDYSGKNSTIYIKTEEICKKMEKQGFKFSFKSLESIWQYFLKPKGFNEEKELRYLRIDNDEPDGYTLASNGVVSGYKDLLLTGKDNQTEKQFPLSLQGIILGPNMKNTEINKYQLEALAFEKGIFLLAGVNCSSIDYYI